MPPKGARFHLCWLCDREFDHHDMWPSHREEHIQHRAESSEERDEYHWICAECEARLQRNEMQDPATRNFWFTDTGWDVLLAEVRSKIAEVKFEKHILRGRVFRKAQKKVKAYEGFNIIFYNIYNIL